MTGSGIEECLKIIYASFQLDKLLNGKSHYKTIRAHFLIEEVCSYSFIVWLSIEELI